MQKKDWGIYASNQAIIGKAFFISNRLSIVSQLSLIKRCCVFEQNASGELMIPSSCYSSPIKYLLLVCNSLP